MTSNEVRPAGGSDGFVHRIITRPIEILFQLPVSLRWEYTRRHPYYLAFWRAAAAERIADDSLQALMQSAATQILRGIGVIGKHPDPGESADALGCQQLLKAWEDGSVAPLTYRGLICLFLTLPEPDRVKVCEVLTTTFDRSDIRQFNSVVERVSALSGPVFDCYLDVPMISVNIKAADQSIFRAVKRLLSTWRTRSNVTVGRRRDDRLEEYMKVWDLREGWNGTAYDGREELSLSEIAQRLEIPISTAENRYKSAFKTIVGQPYSPELWFQLIAPLKLSSLFGVDAAPRFTLNRPKRTRSPDTIPASAHQGGPDSYYLLRAAGETDDELAMKELLLDIETLIAKGCSEVEIAQELELPSDGGLDLVRYVRTHAEELSSSS